MNIMIDNNKILETLKICSECSDCLDCPLYATEGEGAACAAFSAKDIYNLLVYYNNLSENNIDEFVKRLKEKADYYYAYVLVEDIEKIAEDMKNDR